MGPFREHPGLIYVVATLLPLVSFLLLLLAGGVRAFCRARQDNAICAGIYRAMGGDQPSKIGAYIATGAIGLAFVCCLIGFISHASDLHHGDAGHDHAKSDSHEAEGRHATRWSGSMEWARVGFDKHDERPATTLELGYKIDHLSSIMFLMVTFIATLIHLFSIGYMSDELAPMAEDHQVHTEHGHLHRRGRFGRFFMYLSLFCFSMLNLVLADNLFQIFVSWELVGICSYLLIGFYYERQSASNAANKAFITNRVGDAGFIIGLLILWTYVGSLNFDDIFARIRAPELDAHGQGVDLAGHVVRGNVIEELGTSRKIELDPQGAEVVLLPGHLHGHEIAPTIIDPADPQKQRRIKNTIYVEKDPGKHDRGSMPYWLLVVAGLGIFLGCMGKSAQFPLQVWLPDAMEGPTPVSALIHAATMVAAGVYLVGRAYPIFVPESRLVIAYTGGITLFVAATIAIVMTDIKKVLAYSTVSQLGFMMLALGIGGWVAGLFHLLTHAFFKALLFLGSGSVIHGCHHEQDMNRMGGLLKKMPITGYAMLAGCLAIAGTPLFSGWYSKDAIVAQALGFVWINPTHILLLILPLFTAGITTFYMFRMWFMTFTGKPRDHHVHDHAHESPWLMTLPLILLAVCSIAVAWGWPVWDAEASAMEHHVHHVEHHAVRAEFGFGMHSPTTLISSPDREASVAHYAHEFHNLAGILALLATVLGFVFAAVIYWFHRLDPAEAVAQIPAVYRFLWHKWYFDEAYSVLLVRPALAVAHWARWFDSNIIDGLVHRIASSTIRLAKFDGRFDNGVIDGVPNLLARVTYGTGAWLRRVQTGQLRNYVLFIVLAAIALYAVLAYFVNLASAG